MGVLVLDAGPVKMGIFAQPNSPRRC
jgi:hypothetical protein